MANSLPWSVKGVDPRTRDAAKAAARRAGMTLGEWLDHKIRDESEEDHFLAAAPAPTAPEQLDIAALSERLARLSQARTDTAPRQPAPNPSREAIDSLVGQAAALESLTREANARTAGALDSITRWIEKTEDRLSSSERGSAERQERATNVIADAIKTMGERIAEIERRGAEVQQVRAEQVPRLAFSREGLAAAVTDIRTRQRVLDTDEAVAQRPAAVAPERISALREDLREIGSRISYESRRPAQPQRPAAPVRVDTSAIEAKIGLLAERLDRLDRRDQFEPLLKPSPASRRKSRGCRRTGPARATSASSSRSRIWPPRSMRSRPAAARSPISTPSGATSRSSATCSAPAARTTSSTTSPSRSPRSVSKSGACATSAPTWARCAAWQTRSTTCAARCCRSAANFPAQAC